MTVDPGLPRKLGIRPGARVRLYNAPAGYADGLRSAAPEALVKDGDAPEPAPAREVAGTTPVRDARQAATAGVADIVHLFCATRADLDTFAPGAISAYRIGGHLWVSYPKGGPRAGTDLNRDVDWGPLATAGFRPVTQVAIDVRWSALRFRRLEEVGR